MCREHGILKFAVCVWVCGGILCRCECGCVCDHVVDYPYLPKRKTIPHFVRNRLKSIVVYCKKHTFVLTIRDCNIYCGQGCGCVEVDWSE